MAHKLEGTPPETWANTILFWLAAAMNYETTENEQGLVIAADAEEVLERALETIWKYKDLEF